MSAHPMNPVDAAWYHMDGPANLAMVTGIVLTKERLDFGRVKDIFRVRLERFERFRQRVIESGFPLSKPHWEDMPNFAIGQHVHHVALPAPHDQAALVALANDIASAPLDREQPLWQAHVVDEVDGGSAMILRYHHCIGDGTAMMVVIQSLFDTTADAPLQPALPAGAVSRRRPAASLSPTFDAIERAARTAVGAAGAALELVTHPQQALAQAAAVLGGVGMLATELLKAPDPQSPLKGEFGMRKHVAWSQPVAIRDVKAIGAPSGAKVNDVLVAAMTGALRAYLQQRGVDVDHTTVRAMVPVDLRPPERFGQLGNEFGLVILDLAVTTRTAKARLAQTKARMDALKRSPEAIAVRVLFDLLGYAPKPVEDLANQLFGSKASLVMTNVMGPRETLYLAGVPIERMMFWVPHPGQQLGMGISILSYCGMASLAVIADARLVPDPEAITRLFNKEFGRMLGQVRAIVPPDSPGSTKAAGPRGRATPVEKGKSRAKVGG